eukprot:6880726-Karenia_brevis.AAC.1
MSAEELKQFITSVEWEGKTPEWDEIVYQRFADNDVRTIKQLKRCNFNDFQWSQAGLSPGKFAFSKEVFHQFSIRIGWELLEAEVLRDESSDASRSSGCDAER